MLIATTDSTRQAGQRLAWLVFTDELLYCPATPTAVKLFLAAKQAHPHLVPGFEEMHEAMPWFTKNHHAHASTYIAAHHTELAYIDRGPTVYRRPIRLRKQTAKVDTWRKGSLIAFAPLEPLRSLWLSERTSKEWIRRFGDGVLYLAHLHAEQHRRGGTPPEGQQKRGGAIQETDEIAAGLLGWNKQTVKRWRRRFLNAGILEEIKPATTRLPAVYIIPADVALPNASPDLSLFDATKTRTIHTLLLSKSITLRVYASEGEAALIEARISEAADGTREDLRQLAADVATRKPDARWIHAKALTGGLLAKGSDLDEGDQTFLTNGVTADADDDGIPF